VEPFVGAGWVCNLPAREIKEILLRVAVYYGVPVGIDAFRNAREAFKELEGS
jgi:4-carboxymuconolactone decarboxylase